MFHGHQIIHRLKLNLGAHFFGYLVVIVNQILLVPVFLHYWPARIYGEWLVLSAIPLYMALVDFGMEAVGGNRMNMAVAKGDYESATRYLHTYFVFQTAVLLSIFAGVIALAYWGNFSAWLGIEHVPPMAVNVAIVSLTVRALLTCQVGICRAIYASNFLAARGVFIVNASRFVDILLTVALLARGGGVMEISLGILAVQVLTVAVMQIDVHRVCPKVPLGVNRFSSAELGFFLKHGFAYQLLPASMLIIVQGMTLAVNYALGPVAVVAYSVARAVCRTSVVAIQMIGWAFAPELTVLYGRNDLDRAARLFRAMLQGCVWIGLIVALGVLALGNTAVALLTHGKVDVSWWQWIFFVLGVVTTAFWNSAGVLLTSTNQHVGYTKRVFFWSVVLIPFSIFLMWQVGPAGAPLATLMMDLVLCPYVWMACRRLVNYDPQFTLARVLRMPTPSYFSELFEGMRQSELAPERARSQFGPMTLSDNPRVSIIINNYNYGHYVAEAIQSVRRQTYENVELVVVDDGSTDNSREVIESLRQPGDKMVFQKNGGQAAAINAGFAASTGEILIFLDADDYLMPFAAATVVSVRTPETGSFHYRLRLEGQGGRTLGFEPPEDTRLSEGRCDYLLINHGHYVSPPTSGKAFVRTALEKIMPIPDSYRLNADAYLQDSIVFHGTVTAIEEYQGVWRHHGANAHRGWQLSCEYWRDSSDLENLRKLYEFDRLRQTSLEETARKINVAIPPDVIYRNMYRMRPRVMLWKFFPESEWGQQERLGDLVCLSLSAVWLHSMAPLSTRIKQTIWFLGVFVTPVALLSGVMRGFSRFNRRHPGLHKADSPLTGRS